MNKINKYAKREKNKKLHDDDHFILKAAKKNYYDYLLL